MENSHRVGVSRSVILHFSNLIFLHLGEDVWLLTNGKAPRGVNIEPFVAADVLQKQERFSVLN